MIRSTALGVAPAQFIRKVQERSKRPGILTPEDFPLFYMALQIGFLQKLKLKKFGQLVLKFNYKKKKSISQSRLRGSTATHVQVHPIEQQHQQTFHGVLESIVDVF